MQQIDLWEVEIKSAASSGGEWEGIFTGRPTGDELLAAVLAAIEEAERELDSDDYNETVERLHVIYQILDHVTGELDVTPAWQRVEVAGVLIGSIHISIFQGFVAAAPMGKSG